MDTVIGIDLSGITGASASRTVCATLALGEPLRVLDLEQIQLDPAGDRQLINHVVGKQPRVVAIDAPLSLPHGVTCVDPTCRACEPGGANYLRRPADTMAKGMPLVMIAAIAFRGMYIARQFSHRGISVIETYPSAVFRALGLVDRVELRDARARAAMLAPFVEPFDWATGDEVDAVCAAAAAAGWLRAGEPDTTDDIWVKV